MSKKGGGSKHELYNTCQAFDFSQQFLHQGLLHLELGTGTKQLDVGVVSWVHTELC